MAKGRDKINNKRWQSTRTSKIRMLFPPQPDWQGRNHWTSRAIAQEEGPLTDAVALDAEIQPLSNHSLAGETQGNK